MELKGKRILVAGASGALGSRLVAGLESRGCEVAQAARSAGDQGIPLEITDPASCTEAVAEAERRLGGLDGLVVATGAVAFGRSGELDREAERRLIDVNARGPIDLIAAALPRLADGGAVVALSAVVAEYPTAGMAAYSASKAALSAYLTALRRERRKQLDVVLDVRPGHMETGFAERSIAGQAPKLPSPEDEGELVRRILDAVEAGARELRYDPRDRELLEV